MKILTPKATNLELTAAISDYLNKKIGSLEKFINTNDDSASISTEIARTSKHHASGDIFRAEINVHIAGKDFRAEAETSDLYASIDQVRDEMQKVLRRDKKRTLHLIRRGGIKLKNIIRGLNPFRTRT